MKYTTHSAARMPTFAKTAICLAIMGMFSSQAWTEDFTNQKLGGALVTKFKKMNLMIL